MNDQNVDNFSVHETYLILIVLKKDRASNVAVNVLEFSFTRNVYAFLPPSPSWSIDIGCKIIENK